MNNSSVDAKKAVGYVQDRKFFLAFYKFEGYLHIKFHNLISKPDVIHFHLQAILD
jgi:hypothetical protein